MSVSGVLFEYLESLAWRMGKLRGTSRNLA